MQNIVVIKRVEKEKLLCEVTDDRDHLWYIINKYPFLFSVVCCVKRLRERTFDTLFLVNYCCCCYITLLINNWQRERDREKSWLVTVNIPCTVPYPSCAVDSSGLKILRTLINRDIKMVIENRQLWRGSHFNLNGSKDPCRSRNFWVSSSSSSQSSSVDGPGGSGSGSGNGNGNGSFNSDDDDFLRDDSDSFYRRRKRSGTWP